MARSPGQAAAPMENAMTWREDRQTTGVADAGSTGSSEMT
jgi:hypothetical protein